MSGLPGTRGDRGTPGPIGLVVSAVCFCTYLFTCRVRYSVPTRLAHPAVACECFFDPASFSTLYRELLAAMDPSEPLDLAEHLETWVCLV